MKNDFVYHIIKNNLGKCSLSNRGRVKERQIKSSAIF